MRTPLVAALSIALIAAAPLAGPRMTRTVMFVSRGHLLRDGPAAPLNGRHVYYIRDSVDLVMVDRASKTETRILGDMPAGRSDVAVSPSGDRLAFGRNGEDGEGPFLWTLALNPATGLAAGAPKRLGATKVSDPAFSPDGRTIAYGAGQAGVNEVLTIVPAVGGPERVIAATGGDIYPIQWSPDGRTIYFGLSFNDEKDSAKNGVYKVAASGGTPALVTRTADYGAFPGISPDGRWLLTMHESWDSVSLATIDGKRVLTYAPFERNGDDVPDLWLGNDRGLVAVNFRQRPVTVMGFESSKTVTVTDTTTSTIEPRWSSDGKRVAAMNLSPSSIVVSNADGTARKQLVVRDAPARAGVFWSPDGTAIAFNAGRSRLYTLDLASGRDQLLVDSVRGITPRWRSDSRAMMYSLIAPSASGSMSTVSIHERTIGGADRLLRTVSLSCGNAIYSCSALFANDTLLLAWNASEYRMYNLRTQDEGRVVIQNSSTGQRIPTASANGEWLAVRSMNAAGERRVIDVVRADGSSRKTVTLPFATAAGPKNPWISPDGRRLVVAAVPDADNRMWFYDVDVATGKVTRLSSLARAEGPQAAPDPSVSPDGKSVVFSLPRTPFVTFYDVDMSAVTRAAGGRN